MSVDHENLHTDLTGDATDLVAKFSAVLDALASMETRLAAVEGKSDQTATAMTTGFQRAGAAQVAEAEKGATASVAASDKTAAAASTSAERQIGALNAVSAAVGEATSRQLTTTQQFYAKLAELDKGSADNKMALQLATLRNQVEMGQLSLEAEEARLTTLLSKTEENTAQRIAVERRLLGVRREITEAYITNLREEAAAGKISAEQQIAALAAVAKDEEEYVAARALAQKEITRVEAEQAAERVRIARIEAKEKGGIMSRGAASELGYGIGNVAGMGAGYNVQTLMSSNVEMMGQIAIFSAAILAFQGTITFFKDAIKSAADLEAEMRRISVAVENNGEAWSGVNGKLKDFIDSEKQLTGFTDDKLLASFRAIEDAGHKSADAYQILVVAEDVAKARGEDVEAVTRKIIAAEGARGTGLEQLDPKLKDLIKNHATMSELLTQLEKDYRDHAIKATDDYAASVGRLNNAWDDFKQDVGTWLLPWIKDTVNNLTTLVDTIHEVVGALHDMHEGQPNPTVDLSPFAPIHAAENAVAAAASAPKKAGITNFWERWGAAASGDDLGIDDSSSSAPIDPNSPMYRLSHAAEIAHKAANERRYRADQRRREMAKHGIHLGRDPRAGGDPKGSGSGFSATEVELDFSSDKSPLERNAEKIAKEAEQRREDMLHVAEAVKLATSAEGEYQAKLMEASVTVAQADVAVEDLTKQRAAEKAEIDRLTTALPQAKAHLEALVAAQHAAAAAANGTKKDNEGVKVAYQNATAAVTDGQNAYNKLETDLKKVTAAYQSHGAQLTEALIKQQAINEQIAASRKALSDYAVTEADRVNDASVMGAGYEAQVRYWNAVIKGASDAMKAVDDYNNTLPKDSPFRQFYNPRDQQRYFAGMGAKAGLDIQHDIVDPREMQKQQIDARDQASIYAIGALTPAGMDGTGTIRAERAYFEQRLAQIRQFGEQYTGEEKAIRQKIEQLEVDEFKARIDQRKAFVDACISVESLLVDDIIGQHKNLRDTLKDVWNEIYRDFVRMVEKMIIESALFKGLNASIAGAFGFGGGSTGGGGGILSAIGGGAASGPAGPKGTASDPLHTIVTNSGSGFNTAMTGSPNGVPGLGGGGTGFGGGGTAGGAAFGAGGLASLLPLVGMTAAGGSIGRSVGGAAGGGIFGALGAGIGLNMALGGGMGLTGSGGLMSMMALNPLLFGGIMLAGGLIGSGAIGPHYGPESYSPDRHDATYTPWLQSFNSGPGGGGDKLEQLVKALDPKALTGQALADYQKLIALENGTGQLGITAEKNGQFSFIGGTSMSVTDFRAIADRMATETGNVDMSPSSVITRSYPDFNIATIASAAAKAATSDGSPGSGGTDGSGGNGRGAQVTIDLSGATIVGPGGLEDVAGQLSQVLQRVAAGQIAGVSTRSTLNRSYSA
jgi:hypothetical protein